MSEFAFMQNLNFVEFSSKFHRKFAGRISRLVLSFIKLRLSVSYNLANAEFN